MPRKLIRRSAPKLIIPPRFPQVSCGEVQYAYSEDYPKGDEKGYVSWKPNKTTAQMRADIDSVLTEYWDFWPLGPRQVGYVLIGSYGYTKSDGHFDSVGYILGRSRRARLQIARDGETRSWWNAIADGRSPDPLLPDAWDDPGAFWLNVLDWARDYQVDLQDGQPIVIEIWVETASLAPQVARIAHEYGVPVYASSGEVALLPKRNLALRAAQRALTGIATIIFHIGDFDGDGVKIFRAFQADVMAFVRSHGCDGWVSVERLAVTEPQVEHYGLDMDEVKQPKGEKKIPGPALPFNTQAEALNPVQLAEVITGGVERYRDEAASAVAESRSETERTEVLDTIEGILDDLGIELPENAEPEP